MAHILIHINMVAILVLEINKLYIIITVLLQYFCKLEHLLFIEQYKYLGYD